MPPVTRKHRGAAETLAVGPAKTGRTIASVLALVLLAGGGCEREGGIPSPPATANGKDPATADVEGSDTTETDPLAEIRALVTQRNLEKAEVACRARLEASTAASPRRPDEERDSTSTADTLDLLVEILWKRDRGRSVEIRLLAERSVALRRTHGHPNDYKLGTSLRDLATLHLVVGEYAEAKKHFQAAQDILEKHQDKRPLEFAEFQNNLGGLYLNLKDLLPARACFEGALRLRRAHLPPTDPRLTGTLNNRPTLMTWPCL